MSKSCRNNVCNCDDLTVARVQYELDPELVKRHGVRFVGEVLTVFVPYGTNAIWDDEGRVLDQDVRASKGVCSLSDCHRAWRLLNWSKKEAELRRSHEKALYLARNYGAGPQALKNFMTPTPGGRTKEFEATIKIYRNHVDEYLKKNILPILLGKSGTEDKQE